MIKGLLNLLLIILLFLSGLAITVYRLTDAEFLIQQAREVKTYERLLSSSTSIIPEDKLTGLTKEEAEQVIAAGIDGNTSYDFLGKYAQTHLDYLTSRSEKIGFFYELEPVKNRSIIKLNEIVLAKYDSLPICTAQQARNWESEPMSCKLAGSSSSDNDIKNILAEQTSQIFSDLPQSVEVKEISFQMQQLRDRVSVALNVIKGVIGVTVLMLGLYLLIYRRAALLAMAVIFGLVGVIQLGFNLYAWDWLVENVKAFVSGGDYAIIAPIVQDVAATIAQLFKSTLGSVSIVNIFAAMFFLMLLIASFFYKSKKQLTT